MPKKFQGENSKSADARARKEAVKQQEVEKKQKALEDAYWADDDKTNAKKLQRKDEKEKKRQEVLDRKKELAKLHDEEQASLKGGKPRPVVNKVTQHQLELRREKLEKEAAEERAEDKTITVLEDQPIEENLNRLELEGEARTVDDALLVLSGSGEVKIDKNPEKRLRSAYQEFEDRRMPELKAENPTLRLSQLRQLLKKEWKKSPDNPLNAPLVTNS